MNDIELLKSELATYDMHLTVFNDLARPLEKRARLADWFKAPLRNEMAVNPLTKIKASARNSENKNIFAEWFDMPMAMFSSIAGSFVTARTMMQSAPDNMLGQMLNVPPAMGLLVMGGAAIGPLGYYALSAAYTLAKIPVKAVPYAIGKAIDFSYKPQLGRIDGWRETMKNGISHKTDQIAQEMQQTTQMNKNDMSVKKELVCQQSLFAGNLDGATVLAPRKPIQQAKGSQLVAAVE